MVLSFPPNRAVKSRARHGRLEDYAPVDNLEIDSFHSIPYRRDGLPECPISLYTGEREVFGS